MHIVFISQRVLHTCSCSFVYWQEREKKSLDGDNERNFEWHSLHWLASPTFSMLQK